MQNRLEEEDHIAMQHIRHVLSEKFKMLHLSLSQLSHPSAQTLERKVVMDHRLSTLLLLVIYTGLRKSTVSR